MRILKGLRSILPQSLIRSMTSEAWKGFEGMRAASGESTLSNAKLAAEFPTCLRMKVFAMERHYSRQIGHRLDQFEQDVAGHNLWISCLRQKRKHFHSCRFYPQYSLRRTWEGD